MVPVPISATPVLSRASTRVRDITETISTARVSRDMSPSFTADLIEKAQSATFTHFDSTYSSREWCCGRVGGCYM